MKTHWKKLTNPDYIGAYSLNENEERTVKILSVSEQPVKGSDGKDENCIVAKLENEKPLILNKTNCKTITKLYDSAYIEDWTGKSIIIYAAKVRAFGEFVEALRVKSKLPTLPELNPKSDKWNDAIEGVKNGSVKIETIKKHYNLTSENEKLLRNEKV